MLPARKNSGFLFCIVLGDIAAITLSLILAYLFRFTTGFIPVRGSLPDFESYGRVLPVIIPIYLMIFRSQGLYTGVRRQRRSSEIFQVAKAGTWAMLIITAATFFYRGLSYSRISLVVLWVFSIFFISVSRYCLIQWEYRRKKYRKDLTRVMVLGANSHARTLISWARDNPHYGHEIIGLLSSDGSLAGKHIEGVPILAGLEDYESQALAHKPDTIILVENSLSRDETADLVAFCEDKFIDIKIAADFYGLLSRNVEVENITAVPLLGFKPLPLDDPWNRALKRAFDICGSLLLLILSMPFLALAALLIKIGDRGPLFYCQARVGRDERVFDLIKFRTMHVDAEKNTGPVWTSADDARRTRFGNFLRRLNLDELPQIWNVLKGEMSLVGPRPERPHFVNQFRESIPRYMARHKIKSGITGWAQVNGYRGNTSLNERIKYDLYYMENWSLWFDVEILCMTFFAYKNAY